jgi:hypothetical protein
MEDVGVGAEAERWWIGACCSGGAIEAVVWEKKLEENGSRSCAPFLGLA